MVDETNKSFCILPFIHTHLNTEGDVFPCCVGWTQDRKTRIGFIKQNSLEELFNSPEMKQLRLDMVEGKRRPDFCEPCYKFEDNGFFSARNGNNNDFKEVADSIVSNMKEDGYLDPKILSWDIRFSNLCNLKCRTCGSIYSTTWDQENEQQGVPTVGRLNSVPEGMDPLRHQYDNVEKIYFAGGEPLIMPEHFNTLQKLIDSGRAKHVKLVYNTNMTKLNYNNNNLVEYWKQFKQVVLGMSIDGMGERAEYIRNGIKWDVIEQNIRTIAEISRENRNISQHISPTVSIMNVYTLPEMHRYFVENKLIPSVNSIVLNILLGPSYFELRNLSDELKLEVKQLYLNHIEWLKINGADERVLDGFNGVVGYIDNPATDEDVKAFVRRTKELDRIRKQNFEEVFPEYSNWWKQISNV